MTPEELYTDLHRHPELSFEEVRTAGIAADRLRASGYEVITGLGRTDGVVSTVKIRGWDVCNAAKVTLCTTSP